MAVQLDYRDFLPNVDETWEFIDEASPNEVLRFRYSAGQPGGTATETARIEPNHEQQRFWFTGWEARADGLFLTELQAFKQDSRRPINPPLKLTFDPGEANRSELLYSDFIIGSDQHYDGVVSEKHLETIPIDGEPGQRYEWKLRIVSRGTTSRTVVADVTMVLEPGLGLVDYHGQLYGAWFVLKRPWLSRVHPWDEKTLPNPAPPSPPSIRPRAGGGRGAPSGAFRDPSSRLAKEKWDAKAVLDEFARENEYRKSQGLPLRRRNESSRLDHAWSINSGYAEKLKAEGILVE